MVEKDSQKVEKMLVILAVGLFFIVGIAASFAL